jgi:predicted O-methyltransferase YrrM
MPIATDPVARYLTGLRPERSPVMQEMEQLAEKDGIPIVHWETGRLLAILVRSLQPERVLEVGTAIGYSTLHMAEQLERGRIVTLERDPVRIAQAREFWQRAGVADRIQLVEGDAMEEIEKLEGRFDTIFLDASKGEYADYLRMAEPKASERALLAIDNVLMSGSVAFGEGQQVPHDFGSHWASESRTAARTLNRELMSSDRWLSAVLPIGDGVLLASRR